MLTPYQELAQAIVLRAADDYRHYYAGNNKQKAPLIESRKKLEAFFLDPWFGVLTNLDGEVILKALKKEGIQKNRNE